LRIFGQIILLKKTFSTMLMNNSQKRLEALFL
jgi:hypothetical protein